MKRVLNLLVGGAILAMATFASAGNKADTFSVSPMVGALLFEGNQHLEASPVFAGRAGYNFTKAFGIEGLFDFSRTRSTQSSNTLDFYRYGGDLLYHFRPDEKFVPYVALGLAGMNMKGHNSYPETSKTKGVVDYGLGFKYFVTDDMAWRADVRGLTYQYAHDDQHAVEFTTGVYIALGGPVATKLPEPPPAPEPVVKPAYVPPPPAPMAALTASAKSVQKGKDATLSWKSQHATKCEILPGIGSVQPEGSTTVTPDSTAEYTLNCSGDGGTAKSSVSIAVTEPPPVVIVPVVVPTPSVAAERFCNKPAILMINFDTDKWDIKPQYHNELKTVGDFLKEFPKSHGEISGHTDATASKKHNQKLSENRANSVKEYIIKNLGIPPERLTSKGYGKDKPIASNKTKAGKAKNRRIEANFVCE